jgi:hypothetical protein
MMLRKKKEKKEVELKDRNRAFRPFILAEFDIFSGSGPT